MDAGSFSATGCPVLRLYKERAFSGEKLGNGATQFQSNGIGGGKFDSMITSGMKTSRVVFSLEEAAVLGLEIDEDDSHAALGNSSFALRISWAAKERDT